MKKFKGYFFFKEFFISSFRYFPWCIARNHQLHQFSVKRKKVCGRRKSTLGLILRMLLLVSVIIYGLKCWRLCDAFVVLAPNIQACLCRTYSFFVINDWMTSWPYMSALTWDRDIRLRTVSLTAKSWDMTDLLGYLSTKKVSLQNLKPIFPVILLTFLTSNAMLKPLLKLCLSRLALF